MRTLSLVDGGRRSIVRIRMVRSLSGRGEKRLVAACFLFGFRDSTQLVSGVLVSGVVSIP